MIWRTLPFAWIEDCPNLQDNGDFDRLVATAKQAAQNIRDQFDLPLALIVIDTLSAVGNFKDANDAAEGQRIMNRLGELSRQTGAFVLAVDHFGKAVETGTRGSSAKEAAADVVLALLADREINGTISNIRMALRKLRGGKVGTETPFDLRVVDLGVGETTCVVEWKADRAPAQALPRPRSAGPGPCASSSRQWKPPSSSTASRCSPLAARGRRSGPFPSTPSASSSWRHTRQREATPRPRREAKQKAFKRALKQAREKGLVGSREIGGIDYLWLVEPATAEPE